MKSMIHSSGLPTVTAGTWYPVFGSGFGPKSYVGVSHVKIRIPCQIPITTAGIATPFNMIRMVVNGSNQTFTSYSNNLPGAMNNSNNQIELIEIDATVKDGLILMSASVQMAEGYISTVNHNRFVGRVNMVISQSTGTFTDSRDGKVYKTVLMPDGKWWAAENLAWTGAGVDYNNDPLNRPTYGRLYTWAEANSSCPSGTHLPTDAEWTAMEGACGTPATLGTRLKSTTLWSTPGDGTDQYGLAITPGGIADPGFRTLTNEAYYHTSSLYNSGPNIIVRNFSVGVASVSKITNVNSSYKRSVRFIVDSGNVPTPIDITTIDASILGLANGSQIKWDNATMEIH